MKEGSEMSGFMSNMMRNMAARSGEDDCSRATMRERMMPGFGESRQTGNEGDS